jgi:hypothetical protein
MSAQNQYSLFQHICSGVLLNHDPAATFVAVMTNYSVYLDVSGHPSSTPSLVVAGFLASVQDWLEFEPDWNATLKDNGLDPVFHMNQFEYDHKNDPDRTAKLKALIDVIIRHVKLPLLSGIDMDGYRHVNKKFLLEEEIGKPYSIAARYVTKLLKERKSDFGYPERTVIFTERGTLHEGDMKECFIRNGLPEPINVPKELPPAQAADLFAWEGAYFLNSGLIRQSMRLLMEPKEAATQSMTPSGQYAIPASETYAIFAKRPRFI